jgi:REP element-mobilizing transposase RayT
VLHPIRTPSGLPAKGPDLGWFHVVRRGVGRRPVFPTAADIDRFLQLLASASGGLRMEVHACSILSNHCHLLVRGQPRAVRHGLRMVFGTYARHLNRRLDRDGQLFLTRRRETRVQAVDHWCAVIAYIDRNAVEAGLAARPADYPFCSAWHYARGSRPLWLTRDVVESHVRHCSGGRRFDSQAYSRVFPALTGGHMRTVVERRLAQPARTLGPTDDLLDAAPAHVRQWLERRAMSADGLAAGPALAAPAAILQALRDERRADGDWLLPPRGPSRSGPRRDGWRVLAAGLLRTSAGMALAEVAESLGISVSGAHQLARQHGELLLQRPEYAARAQRLLSSALRRTRGREGPVDL